jgi:hypothetical protein
MAEVVVAGGVRGESTRTPPTRSPIAGLLLKFTRTGNQWTSVSRFNCSGREFKRYYAEAMPILLDKNYIVFRINRNDLNPIGIFQNVERCNFFPL